MKKIGTLLVLLGLFVAVPYVIYVTGFSGVEIGQFPLKQGGGIPIGSVVVGSSTGTNKGVVGPLTLDPGMNPLRINLHVDYDSTRTSGRMFQYQVGLLRAGSEVWSGKGQHSRTTGKKKKKTHHQMTNISLSTVRLDTQGEYQVSVNVDPNPQANIRSIRISVRRNVAELNYTIVGVGVAMLLLGLALHIFGAISSASSKS